MFSNKEKISLYSLLCIPIRSTPIIALYRTKKFNSKIAIFYLLLGLSFLYRSTTYTTSQIGLFGGKVWWQNLRIIHGLSYVIVYQLIKKKKINVTKNLLLLDLSIGILKFVKVYYK